MPQSRMVYLVSMLLKTLTSFYAKEVSTTKKLMPSYGAIGTGTTQYVVSEFMSPPFQPNFESRDMSCEHWLFRRLLKLATPSQTSKTDSEVIIQGDLSLFPHSTSLYVGPGFKHKFMPGYPINTDSPMLDKDFKGRAVHEISFDNSNKIGAFPSHDLFGDGSFYILDVPGHAIGHVSGFARTTPDTFVFMGGDICHFGGSYRPTVYAPMPSTIPPSVPLDRRLPTPCPCSFFASSHHDPENLRTLSFYNVTQDPGGWYVNPPTAQKSVKSLEEFDADENVFVCVAHDGGLIPVVDWFPNGTVNDWKKKGWKEESQWGFLNELPIDGKPGRPWLTPGLVKEGKVMSKEDL